MQVRLRVAALDHNHSVQREMDCTKSGTQRFKLEYSKPAGQYIVKAIKVQKTWSFRKEILVGVANRCTKGTKQSNVH